MKLTRVDICPVCGSNKLVVLDTRMRNDDNCYRRRRKCCNVCNYRFTTVELLMDDFNKMSAKVKLLDQIKETV